MSPSVIFSFAFFALLFVFFPSVVAVLLSVVFGRFFCFVAPQSLKRRV